MVEGSGEIESVKLNEIISKREVVDIVAGSGIPYAELEELAQTDRLLGVRVSDIPVIFYDIEHDRPTDLPTVSHLTSDPNTVGAVVEYFMPEITENDWTGKTRRWLEDTDQDLDEGSTYRNRVLFGREVGDRIGVLGKPVIAADIADSPTYMVQRHADFLLATTSLAATVFAGASNQDILPYAATTLGSCLIGLVKSMGRPDVLNPDPNMSREQYILYLEDARRYYLAQALKKSVPQLKEAWNMRGGTNQHLVAFYPQAHGRRVVEHLTHPRRAYSVKDPFYRFVQGSFSDFNARVYYPSADTANLQWTKGEAIPF